MIPICVERDSCGGCRVTFELNSEEDKFLYQTGINFEYGLTNKPETITKGPKYVYKPNDTKVIFNHPATILFINGKKYVSKAYEEEFDEEKGLLMCLAKASGISHLELKRMIKDAQYHKLPPKERKSINGVSVGIKSVRIKEEG